MSAGYEIGVGLLLGFSLTVAPGPMNALIASQSVRSWRAGFVTGLGAMSADAVLGGLVFALSAIVDFAAYLRWVYVLGCGVMAFMGYRLLVRRRVGSAPDHGPVRTYSTALAFGVSNPFQILWWLTAGLAFAYLGGLVLFAGLFGAILVWIVGFPYAVAAGARGSPRAEQWVTVGSGAILLAFAAYFAYLAAV